MQHVIIGAGHAGVVAAEHIRKLDADAQISLLGGEPEPPYSRMAIPYYLIRQIEEQGIYLRKAAGHFEGLGIDLRQDRVSAVDTAARRLSLEDGGSLDYDRLLIATGSSPITPPVPGVESAGVFNCWTLDDARHVIERCQSGNRVLLMGAGFIGCIILEALAVSGVELTVVELQNRMVPRMMNEVSGGLIKRWCEHKGVAVHTSTKVEAIEPANGAGLNVVLSNGQAVGSDMVIVAAGVKSNIDFLAGSGIDLDQGVLVDQYLQTNQEGVFAAGDACQGKDFSTGDYSVQPIQPTAAMGLISSSFGLWMGVDGGDSAELHDSNNYRYLNLQFQDDVLVGASSLGLTEHVGVLRGLIQSRTRLGDWKNRLIQDPTRIMEAYLARTQAIGHNAHVV